MDRQTGLIVAAVSVILCACPGIGLCAFGGLLFGAPVTDPAINPAALSSTGALLMLCGFGMSLVPLAIGLYFWTRKAEKTYTPEELEEELPPAI